MVITATGVVETSGEDKVDGGIKVALRVDSKVEAEGLSDNSLIFVANWFPH